jgi:hypothetical protein
MSHIFHILMLKNIQTLVYAYPGMHIQVPWDAYPGWKLKLLLFIGLKALHGPRNLLHVLTKKTRRAPMHT